nr:hypothetical protein [uncultured Roseateles sp.]
MPSAIHAMACARRFSRVPACFASTIHSMYSRCWPGRGRLGGPGLHAVLDEAHRALQDGLLLRRGRQVLERGDAAEIAHGAVLRMRRADGRRPMPEADRAMRLEGGHAGQDPVAVGEVGEAPLDRLDDLGAVGMHGRAPVPQDLLREGSGALDVGIDAGIEGGHGVAA